MTVEISGVATEVTFVGGTEDGKTRKIWATREVVVAVQSHPIGAHDLSKIDLSAALAPKSQRQIYTLAYQHPNGRAVYRLSRVEVP